MYANLIKIPNNLIIMFAFFLTIIFTPITCGMCIILSVSATYLTKNNQKQ